MKHRELLKQLLPPVAYDVTGIALSAEIEAAGARLDAAQAITEALLIEIDPRTTELLLDDWERVYGLPDGCADIGESIAQRRTALLAKVSDSGGLSKQYFLHLAERLEYRGTSITTFVPSNCEMTCEIALRDVWRSVWYANLPNQGYSPPTTEFLAPTSCETNCDARVFEMPWPELRFTESENHRSFRAGSRCDERIDSYLFGSLECQFMRLKPAHTHVIFTYRGLPDEAH